MQSKAVQRRLTTILSADVEGYSRLMGEDEISTISTLTAYQKVMVNLIQRYRGRVVDSPGDNLLAEFSSVVDGVECAIDIQKELEVKNSELPQNRRMEFRIGINLADVILDRGRIYGDGVNIAARIERLAEVGGVCISGTVYDHVKNKLGLGYEYIGEQTVKNIKDPVRVYRVRTKGETAIPRSRRELELPDKPSIAVVPFVNMSGDAEQEYFTDGITMDLISDLSRVSGLFVIAPQSAFTYKNKPVKVQEIGRELGVRYVLGGSVRKAGDCVRITAHLVDATTGGHLWTERYGGDLRDIFVLQDEVTQKIRTALALKLTEEEEDSLVQRYTENLKAYDYNLRGMEHFFRATKEANVQAREMFQKSIELDPEYAIGHSRLGRTYLMDWHFGWSEDPQSLERAFELAQRAIRLDDSLPEAHSLLGEIYLWKKEHDQAVLELERTISLDPNSADGLADLGNVLSFVGRPEEAIVLVKKGMRLNPLHPAYYLFHLGHAYLLMERYAEATAALERAINRNPDFWHAYFFLVVSYVALGEEEKGAETAEKLKIHSGFSSFESWMQKLPYKNQAILERLGGSVRSAGLK